MTWCEINWLSTAHASYRELFFSLTLLITVGNPESNSFLVFSKLGAKILGVLCFVFGGDIRGIGEGATLTVAVSGLLSCRVSTGATQSLLTKTLK